MKLDEEIKHYPKEVKYSLHGLTCRAEKYITNDTFVSDVVLQDVANSEELVRGLWQDLERSVWEELYDQLHDQFPENSRDPLYESHLITIEKGQEVYGDGKKLIYTVILWKVFPEHGVKFKGVNP